MADDAIALRCDQAEERAGFTTQGSDELGLLQAAEGPTNDLVDLREVGLAFEADGERGSMRHSESVAEDLGACGRAEQQASQKASLPKSCIAKSAASSVGIHARRRRNLEGWRSVAIAFASVFLSRSLFTPQIANGEPPARRSLGGLAIRLRGDPAFEPSLSRPDLDRRDLVEHHHDSPLPASGPLLQGREVAPQKGCLDPAIADEVDLDVSDAHPKLLPIDLDPGSRASASLDCESSGQSDEEKRARLPVVIRDRMRRAAPPGPSCVVAASFVLAAGPASPRRHPTHHRTTAIAPTRASRRNSPSPPMTT